MILNRLTNRDHWIFILVILFACPLNVLSQSPAETAPMSKAVASSVHNALEWAACPAPLTSDGCYITVLHGNPAEPNADILFKLEPGAGVPRHWHSSAERMVMISGVMEVTYDGEKTQVLKPGTYAYGPADKPHTAKCLDGEPCVLFIAFEKPVDAFVEQ